MGKFSINVLGFAYVSAPARRKGSIIVGYLSYHLSTDEASVLCAAQAPKQRIKTGEMTVKGGDAQEVDGLAGDPQGMHRDDKEWPRAARIGAILDLRSAIRGSSAQRRIAN